MEQVHVCFSLCKEATILLLNERQAHLYPFFSRTLTLFELQKNVIKSPVWWISILVRKGRSGFLCHASGFPVPCIPDLLQKVLGNVFHLFLSGNSCLLGSLEEVCSYSSSSLLSSSSDCMKKLIQSCFLGLPCLLMNVEWWMMSVEWWMMSDEFRMNNEFPP